MSNNFGRNIVNKIGEATLASIISIISVLNIGSWLVGAIWLAILGEWRLLLYGLLLSIAMPYVYSLVIIPQMLLAAWLAMAFEKKQKLLVRILAFVSTIYQYAVLMFWVLYVFEMFLNHYPEINMIPLILYGYSTMSAPLVSMGSKEGPGATGTYLAIFIAEASYLLILALSLLGFSRGSVNNILWLGIIGLAIYMSKALIPDDWDNNKDSEHSIVEAEIVSNERTCEKCNKQVKLSSQYCGNCGHKLSV